MEHLSPSGINLFTNCAEAGRRRYINGEKIPPGWAAARGGGAHKSIEKNMLHKMATGELLPIEAIRDFAADGVEAAAMQGIRAESAEEKEKGFVKMLGETKDAAIAAAIVHHSELAPVIHPLAVEERFEIETDIGMPIVGIVDLLANLLVQSDDGSVSDSGSPEVVIRDTKTAKAKKSQADADSSMQLSVYTLAREAITGIRPKSALDVVVMTKVPKVQIVTTQRSDLQMAAMWNRIDAVVAMLKAGVFPPAAPDFWMCSQKWCGYYDTCPFAGGARIAIG